MYSTCAATELAQCIYYTPQGFWSSVKSLLWVVVPILHWLSCLKPFLSLNLQLEFLAAKFADHISTPRPSSGSRAVKLFARSTRPATTPPGVQVPSVERQQGCHPTAGLRLSAHPPQVASTLSPVRTCSTSHRRRRKTAPLTTWRRPGWASTRPVSIRTWRINRCIGITILLLRYPLHLQPPCQCQTALRTHLTVPSTTCRRTHTYQLRTCPTRWVSTPERWLVAGTSTALHPGHAPRAGPAPVSKQNEVILWTMNRTNHCINFTLF